MRRAAFLRAEYAARSPVAHALQSLQCPPDAKSSIWHLTGKQSFDVFDEDAFWPHLLESGKPIVKEESLVASSFA
jgi:hypothetical protein